MNGIAALTERLAGVLTPLLEQAPVPGVVVGVWHDGDQSVLARGVANVATGTEMTADTGWLLGSITKVLTTVLMLRLVERGLVDLDEPVTRYLRDFRLADPDAAHRLTVRHLLNHTNGIDADTLMPVGERGDRAVASYVDALASCGTLWEPGALVSYSNPGFCVAGRVAEVVCGTPFDRLLETEVFAAAGMPDACTSPHQAILRPTATGSFPGEDGGRPRQTRLFMLPASAAPAGATPIVTAGDMLAFGRAMLAGGVAVTGDRVLSSDHVRLMGTVSKDMGTPNVPPVGLGWWVVPIAGTTALWHSGGSPGGASNLMVVPDHDLVVVSFANGTAAPLLHDAIVAATLHEVAGAPAEDALAPPSTVAHLSRVDGVYAAFQVRNVVARDDAGMTLATDVLPIDEDHERLLDLYLGGATAAPAAQVMHDIGGGLFAPAGIPPARLSGATGRTAMASFSHVAADGRPRFLHHRLRATRRED